MSRIIEHNNMVVNRVPSELLTHIGTYGAIQSTGPATNAFTSTNSETYCDYNPATGAEGGPTFGFGNFNEIPEDATINSVSCSVKIRCSNANGMIRSIVQLYAGDTPKGTEVDFTNSTGTTVRNFTDTGTWTRDELDSLRLAIIARRQSSRRVYFYGADLSINYSYNEVQYQVTVRSESETSAAISVANEWNTEGSNVAVTVSNVSNLLKLGVFDNGINVASEMTNTSSNNYSYTIEEIDSDHTIVLEDVSSYNISISNNSTNISSLNPPVGNNYEVGEGSNFEIEIYPIDIEKVCVFDNNVDRTSYIISAQTHEEDTSVFNPSSYLNNSFATATSVTNGYAGTDSTSRATLQGARSTLQSIDYKFDVSSIPTGATILSVSCAFKISVSNTYSTGNVALYVGDSMRSNANSSWRSNTTATVYQLSGIGDINRDELNNLVLRINGNTTSAGRSIYFYGADLSVSYEYNGDVYYVYTAENISQNRDIRFEDKSEKTIYLKSNGQFNTVSKTYKKILGSWVEQVDVTNIFNNGTIYING